MATMKDLAMALPVSSPDTVPQQERQLCTLIIMVESGVVTDILPTGPLEAVIVNLDRIENDDPFEQRMYKSVLPMNPGGQIEADDMPALITAIVREYSRSGRRRAAAADGTAAA